MKRIVLTLFIIGGLLSSCSDNGNKAETKEAKEVEVNKSVETLVYNQVKDGSHTDWKATHLGGVNPRFGKIKIKNAELLVNNNKLTNASIVMDMASFTVESFPEGDEQIGQLTGHLQSADFFNIEKYPTTKFELTGIESIEGDYTSEVTGNLTILDVTKSVTFKVNISVLDNEVSVESENFVVDRTDWGLVYNTDGTVGVPADYLISNEVGFKIDVTITK
jgi:polyisoprenoid-binding protein YceI